MITLKNKVVLITGANGELILKNVSKIYATGLKIESLKDVFNKYGAKVVPIELDVTNSTSIKKCAALCADTNMLINNAGVELKVPFISDRSSEAALLEMKVNYIGVMEMINSFVPLLEKNKETCIVNILSIGSFVIVRRLGSYCASKTATHILTETIREELAEKGIRVMAVYMGYVNTQMVPEETKSLKSEPDDIVRKICEGLEKGNEKIYPDKITQNYIQQNPVNTIFFE
jgi:NAD(P)-dependent dehydrogenase (short-subunit alcohol dehydrogenase family)